MVDSLKKKSIKGGKRPGAGRKRGSVSKKTLERKIVEEEIKQRVLREKSNLLNCQFSLAYGCSYLYKISKNKKGEKQKPELITDTFTIERYLSGEFDKKKDEYYFITTDKPNGYVIDSLLDRTFGKATQVTELSGRDGEPLLGPVIYKPSKDDK